jgi:hypothetical protein
MKDRQYNYQKKKGQKDKQLSAKHYMENSRLNNTNPTKYRGMNSCVSEG